MGKRKRNNGGEQNRVPKGVLPQLYPNNPRLGTLHDLLITLLIPSLQYPHASAAETTDRQARSISSAGMPNLQAALPERAIAAAHALLVREGDDDDYLFLLHHGYGVLSDAAPTFANTTLEQRWTHKQVIERAIQILFKQEKQSMNVLCFGFQQPKPRSLLGRESIGPAGLSCVHDNAALSLMNSQPWRTLHARVGDLIMLHLLSYADLFHPLPHKFFVQIAGTSVLLAAQQVEIFGDRRHHSMQKTRDAKPTFWKKRRVSLDDAEENGDLIRSAGFDAPIDIRRRQHEGNPSIHRNVFNGSRKRQRPYSWQRRKSQKGGAGRSDEKSTLMKHHNSRGVAPPSFHPNSLKYAEDGSTMQGEVLKVYTSYGASSEALPGTQEDSGLLCSRSTKGMENEGLNILALDFLSQPKSICSVGARVEEEGTQEDKDDKIPKEALLCAQEAHITVKAKGCTKSLSAVCNLTGTGFAKRLINRTKMFYKAKFPQHAGLPKHHILES